MSLNLFPILDIWTLGYFYMSNFLNFWTSLGNRIYLFSFSLDLVLSKTSSFKMIRRFFKMFETVVHNSSFDVNHLQTARSREYPTIAIPTCGRNGHILFVLYCVFIWRCVCNAALSHPRLYTMVWTVHRAGCRLAVCCLDTACLEVWGTL